MLRESADCTYTRIHSNSTADVMDVGPTLQCSENVLPKSISDTLACAFSFHESYINLHNPSEKYWNIGIFA